MPPPAPIFWKKVDENLLYGLTVIITNSFWHCSLPLTTQIGRLLNIPIT
jgi:hypothetical protein